MKKKMKLLATMFVTVLYACAEVSMHQPEVPAPQNVFARETQSLNGAWNYFVDVQEQGYYDYRMNPTKWGYFLNAKPQRPSDLVECKQLLLNGKPIFLRGVCAHEEAAYTNRRATCAADADTLINWAKSMNCNFLRLAHYPHNEHAIREADRQGMLLWEEIPVYWTISWSNPATYDNAHRQLSDLIRRDKNRAATIIWSIANETPHSDARDSFLSRLATSARQQDPTRLISMAMEVLSASNYVNRLQDNMNQYVDVISFNQYVGWYRDVNDAKKMKWEIPYDKPVIISEFGGGAKAGYNGAAEQRWTEEFQERLYQENLDMLDKIDGLAGTCPWVLKDFRSPRRPLPEIQDFFNRKGLFSDQGKRKKAFYVLRDWYEKKK